MELMEFEQIFRKYLEKMDINLNEKQMHQFYEYMQNLIEWNEKINLTAITEPEEIIVKHFVDSLTISKYINKDAKIIDVGTGAGFPGIPLKIYRDDIEVILLDSLNKRINFLNDTIKKIGLEKITANHGRAEEFARNKKYREKFDVATSRAVANMSTLSEYLIPFVKLGGTVVAMKGSEIDEEVQISKNAINVLGGKILNVEEFNLPGTDIKRNIVLIKKEKVTLAKFPRKAGTPSKEPL
jgi:16S rRNA (guanine527-N7)-methyltransferase